MSLLSLFGCKPRAQEKPPEPKHDPGTFVDPFSLQSIDRVTIEVKRDGFYHRPGMFVETTVWFKKGDTTGYHCIFSPTLEEMLPKVKAFLEATR